MYLVSDEQHEKNLKNFETKNWKKLDYDERLEALQMLENRMADEQGRKAREITPTKLEEGVTGTFDSRYPTYMQINEEYLYKEYDYKGKSYEAMDTVIHEGRHAYQYDVIRGKEVKCPPNEETLRQWKENDLVKIKHDENPIKYRFQSKEDDAYNFAHSKVKSFEEYFKNDKHYKKYTQKLETKRNQYEKDAQEHIGENFKEKINNEISERYNQKQLTDLQKEYSRKHQEARILNDRADRMKLCRDEIHDKEMQIVDIKRNRKNYQNADTQIKRLENSREKAHEFFKREYNVEPINASETIDNLREQAAVIKLEIEPTKEKIEALQDQLPKHQEMEKHTMLNMEKEMTKGYELLY